MLKILQARLQQYMNWELPDVQTGFRKGRETRDQITNIRCIIEKARELQKNIYSASLTMLKPLTVWITTNWTILRWEYQTTLPLSWDTCMQVKKQQLESDVEIKRCLFLGRKALTNLDSILKSRDITLPTEVHLLKAMVFPVVMYRCESWTLKKAEHQRMMLSNCAVGEDSWECLGQQDQTSQS